MACLAAATTVSQYFGDSDVNSIAVLDCDRTLMESDYMTLDPYIWLLITIN
jgi:hypothetical protein